MALVAVVSVVAAVAFYHCICFVVLVWICWCSLCIYEFSWIFWSARSSLTVCCWYNITMYRLLPALSSRILAPCLSIIVAMVVVLLLLHNKNHSTLQQECEYGTQKNKKYIFIYIWKIVPWKKTQHKLYVQQGLFGACWVSTWSFFLVPHKLYTLYTRSIYIIYVAL